MIGYSFKCDTKYFLQIWSGTQAVKKLRPDFIAGPPAARLLKNLISWLVKKTKKTRIFWLESLPPPSLATAICTPDKEYMHCILFM